MAFFVEKSLSVNVTTNKTTTYSTAINGELYGILYEPSTANALQTTNVVKMYHEESTGWVLFAFAPSTTPHMYYPRNMIHSSTAAQIIPATTVPFGGVCHCLAYDRVRVIISNSSGGSTTMSGTLRFYINGPG